jgi:hypothetical protein
MPGSSPTHTAAVPWARIEVINQRLVAIVDAGQLTGHVTIHFRDGKPMSMKVSSEHGEWDTWGMGGATREGQ